MWSGSPNVHHKAKISWNYLCLAKCEGGLGIRKLRETSKVFASDLIWQLFSLSGYLWVSWVGVELLGGGSFWNAKDSKRGFSFGVNCLNSDQRLRGLCEMKLEVASRPSSGLMIG